MKWSYHTAIWAMCSYICHHSATWVIRSYVSHFQVYLDHHANVYQQMPIARSHLSMSTNEGRMTSPGGSQCHHAAIWVTCSYISMPFPGIIGSSCTNLGHCSTAIWHSNCGENGTCVCDIGYVPQSSNTKCEQCKFPRFSFC